jgi:hypothetical protein
MFLEKQRENKKRLLKTDRFRSKTTLFFRVQIDIPKNQQHVMMTIVLKNLF